MFLQRKILNKLNTYLDSREFLALIGTRQAGKTTILKYLAEKLIDRDDVAENQVHYFTFEDPLILEKFTNDPVAFITELKAKERTYYFIDEYHLAKNGGSHLKLIYDTIDQVKIIISGSSSLELNEIGAKMVGRMLTFTLRTLSFAEFVINQTRGSRQIIAHDYQAVQKQVGAFIRGEKTQKIKEISLPSQVKQTLFNLLDQYIRLGGYPAVVKENNLEARKVKLLNIYNAYVEKDIIRLLQIGKTEVFFDLINYLAINIGQLINYSSMQNDLNATYRQVKKYLQVLDKTFLISQIKPYYQNKSTTLKKSPLVYFNDLGLRNWAVRNFNSIEIRSDKGNLVENAVLRGLQEIKDWNYEIRDIYFWRKQSGTEVDFVLDVGGKLQGLIPVEVKFQPLDTPQITRSYHSFLQTYQPSRGLVVTKDYFGSRQVKGTLVWFVPAYCL